ncbi:hypothetical protein LOAG_11492 [Loa loa]|uniref:Uncharacterized protein n=1 Tax=Loa loa TaxID=7209 RepID=A0A1S0TPE6_LOALO|nr:hypothetical protein LOAG_11492 [Loa loa]EFO17011.1 hypothetical protein LOAG_11492 [Loa loa]
MLYKAPYFACHTDTSNPSKEVNEKLNSSYPCAERKTSGICVGVKGGLVCDDLLGEDVYWLRNVILEKAGRIMGSSWINMEWIGFANWSVTCKPFNSGIVVHLIKHNNDMYNIRVISSVNFDAENQEVVEKWLKYGYKRMNK